MRQVSRGPGSYDVGSSIITTAGVLRNPARFSARRTRHESAARARKAPFSKRLTRGTRPDGSFAWGKPVASCDADANPLRPRRVRRPPVDVFDVHASARCVKSWPNG